MRRIAFFFTLLVLAIWGDVPTIAHAAGAAHSALVDQLVFPDLTGADSDTVLKTLQDKRVTCRSAAVREIGRREMKSAAGSLKPLLNDEALSVRIGAAEVLLGFGDKSGVQTLRDVVTDSSAASSAALRAAIILAKEGDESGQMLALSKLSSKYFTKRVMAMDVLKYSKDPEIAYSAMQIGLGDSHEHVRRAAVWNLGKMGTMQGLALLEEAMTIDDPSERSSVVSAIGNTRLWAGVPLLIEALGDTKSLVRGQAARQLNVLTGLNYSTRLSRKPDTAKELQQQWREWWDANKANYPTGTKSPVPKPKPDYSR